MSGRAPLPEPVPGPWLPRAIRPQHARAQALLARFDRRRARALRVSPAYLDLDYQSLRLQTDDGLALAAWLVPAASSRAPRRLCALMHHHYGGQRAAMLAWIELFTRLGVDCLAFDARGHGASPCRATEETYRQRFADVRAARNELHRRGYETIIGFGQSQGGAVLIGALAHDPALAGMILDSGPSATALPSLVGLARLMQREAGGPAARPEIAPGTMAVAPPASERLTTALLAGLLFRRTGPATYPLFLWRGLWQLRRRPLLWLHGTADSVIERHRAARWYAPLRRVAPAWRELRVEGAEHVQCLQHSPAAVERAVTAFVQRMAG